MTAFPPKASEGPSLLVMNVDLELGDPWRAGQATNKENGILCQIDRKECSGGEGGGCRIKDGRVIE